MRRVDLANVLKRQDKIEDAQLRLRRASHILGDHPAAALTAPRSPSKTTTRGGSGSVASSLSATAASIRGSASNTDADLVGAARDHLGQDRADTACKRENGNSGEPGRLREHAPGEASVSPSGR
ncbi:MAG: hypothetical protein ACRD8O_10615 [Bryobacteraceae bacterium]